jgi:hypothetical protein
MNVAGIYALARGRVRPIGRAARPQSAGTSIRFLLRGSSCKTTNRCGRQSRPRHPLCIGGATGDRVTKQELLPARVSNMFVESADRTLGRARHGVGAFGRASARLLIPEEAAPQFLDDAAPRNGMMSPPDSEMIAPPITE